MPAMGGKEGVMPKETVQGSVYEDQNTRITSRFDVEVAWGRETSYVQVATVDPDAKDALSKESGLHVDLDRAKINQLIRVLRKARDQAFGADA